MRGNLARGGLLVANYDALVVHAVDLRGVRRRERHRVQQPEALRRAARPCFFRIDPARVRSLPDG
jgi:hypothetical protein